MALLHSHHRCSGAPHLEVPNENVKPFVDVLHPPRFTADFLDVFARTVSLQWLSDSEFS
jgi:hypothetical protein